MKTYMPLNGLRWSRNSGSANCDMPQSAVFGRPGGGILPLLLSGCRAIMLITNKWNSVFPLNIVIVFAIICLAAYLLKVMTAAFLSLLSKDKFSLEV